MILVVAGGNDDRSLNRKWLRQAVERVRHGECKTGAVLESNAGRGRLFFGFKASRRILKQISANPEFVVSDSRPVARARLPGRFTEVMRHVVAAHETYLRVEVRLHGLVPPDDRERVVAPGGVEKPCPARALER